MESTLRYKTFKGKLNNEYYVFIEGEMYITKIPILLPKNVVWENASKDIPNSEQYKLVDIKLEEI